MLRIDSSKVMINEFGTKIMTYTHKSKTFLRALNQILINNYFLTFNNPTIYVYIYINIIQSTKI